MNRWTSETSVTALYTIKTMYQFPGSWKCGSLGYLCPKVQLNFNFSPDIFRKIWTLKNLWQDKVQHECNFWRNLIPYKTSKSSRINIWGFTDINLNPLLFHEQCLKEAHVICHNYDIMTFQDKRVLNLKMCLTK